MPARSASGSVLLEMAIAVPSLLLVVLVGVVMAQAASAKASLQMTTARAARELAAGEAADRIPGTEQSLFLYNEFTETYGLPRPKVKMLVGKVENQYIVAGACYRLRLPLPSFQPDDQPLPWALALARQVMPAQETLIGDLNRTWQDAKQAYDTADNLAARLQAITQRLTATVQSGAFEATEFVPLKRSFTNQNSFDEAVKSLCGGGLDLVVNARAAYWSEQSFHEASSAAQGGQKVGQQPGNSSQQQQLELTLQPSVVMLYADDNPNTIPAVTAIVKAPPQTRQCQVSVTYKNPSQARQQNQWVRNSNYALYLATWHVGAGTLVDQAQVAATCDGNSVSRTLPITHSQGNRP